MRRRSGVSVRFFSVCRMFAFASLPWVAVAWVIPSSLSSSRKRVGKTRLGMYVNNTGEESSSFSAEHPMAKTSFLSHVMLKVPSVNDAVEYWTRKGGKIRVSKTDEDPAKVQPNGGSVKLKSAFVELGCAKTDAAEPLCFALELVAHKSTSKHQYSIGNAISYIGVSMLMQFQNNLLGAISGDSPESQGEEPNGIPVKSAASAPGDFLARLALRTNQVETTQAFYASKLGMEVMAQDENMLCLRYNNDCFQGGVPTTLVFDVDEEPIEMGDCLDHFVIATKSPIDALHSQLEAEGNHTIFMKPTNMYGKQVMGLIDPNGYKVILASA